MVEVMIEVEVVYAAVDRQVLLTVSVPVGTSVRAALLRSAVAEEFPELDLANCPVGIFGKVVADPKEVRRLRAAKAAEAKARNQ
jgi:putative ubiquitin-RnfH superfamily antitoxin RatB of RatAB toxin-antitoxin module